MLQKVLWGVGKAIAIRILIDELGLDELLGSGSGDGDESGTGTDSTGTDNFNGFYGGR